MTVADPVLAWVVLTTACNNRCAHCYQSRDRVVSMSGSLLRRSLDALAAVNCQQVVLLGGEPTLSPLLVDAVQETVRLGMEPLVVTNGTRLTPALIDELASAGVSHVTVSIEGDEALHDEVTGRHGSYEESLRGVGLCVDASVQVGTMTTISRGDPEPYLRMLAQLEPYQLVNTFNFAVPSIAEAGSPPIFSELGAVARRLFEASPAVVLNATIPLCALGTIEQLIPLLADRRVRVGCQAQFNYGFAIDADGRILPCTHFDGCGVGLLDEGLDQVMIRLAEVATALQTYPDRTCEACGLAGYCHGGCPLFRLNELGSAWGMRGVEMDALEIARRIKGERMAARAVSPVRLAVSAGQVSKGGATLTDCCDCDGDGEEYSTDGRSRAVAASADCCDWSGCDRSGSV